jgi:hypothetical protein
VESAEYSRFLIKPIIDQKRQHVTSAAFLSIPLPVNPQHNFESKALCIAFLNQLTAPAQLLAAIFSLPVTAIRKK